MIYLQSKNLFWVPIDGLYYNTDIPALIYILKNLFTAIVRITQTIIYMRIQFMYFVNSSRKKKDK